MFGGTANRPQARIMTGVPTHGLSCGTRLGSCKEPQAETASRQAGRLGPVLEARRPAWCGCLVPAGFARLPPRRDECQLRFGGRCREGPVHTLRADHHARWLRTGLNALSHQVERGYGWSTWYVELLGTEVTTEPTASRVHWVWGNRRCSRSACREGFWPQSTLLYIHIPVLILSCGRTQRCL